MEHKEELEISDLDYFTIAKLEGIQPNQLIDVKLRYKNLKKLNLKELSKQEYKIPPISHHIWLTNLNKPEEIREKDYIYFNNLIKMLDSVQDSWQHLLWTNCKDWLPITNNRLQSLQVELHDISEIQD